MNLSRRRLFGMGVGLIASPAIVRISSLMPVKVMQPEMIYSYRGMDIQVWERLVHHEIERIVRPPVCGDILVAMTWPDRPWYALIPDHSRLDALLAAKPPGA